MKIYVSMLSPERMGVSGSRWMIVENDVLIVTSLQDFSLRLKPLIDDKHEIITVESDTAKKLIERLL